MDLVTISYTPLDAPGGVPRFNRDIHKAFQDSQFTCRHYSWWDVCQAQGWDPNSQYVLEWDKAQVLNSWLLWTKKVTRETVVIADSFWAGGLESLPYCISHQHGNWSHTTLDDVQKGIKPEFPKHAMAQEQFRRRYIAAGRKLTAVSDFIAEQMKLQWGFESKVINNGIATDMFRPAAKKTERQRPIIIHFVTNANKGYEHISAVKEAVDADVWLLDEAAKRLHLPKYEALAQADLVVHPSAHEGNSYAALETLACGVPLVCYDVGLMYRARIEQGGYHAGEFGVIMDRNMRSPELTAKVTKTQLYEITHLGIDKSLVARSFAERFDIQNFMKQWQEHVDDLLQSR